MPDRAPWQQIRSDVPPVPEGVTGDELEGSLRRNLEQLGSALATRVAQRMVAIELALDEGDVTLALAHAREMRRAGSRSATVRQTAGTVAYLAGEWHEAANDLRAARRMLGDDALLPMIADCERGMGRPERALATISDAAGLRLAPEIRVELLIVEAGARRDLNQHQAALLLLEGPARKATKRSETVARLRYAYADVLAQLGRDEEAIDWFGKAAEFDAENVTDAHERVMELLGVELTDLDEGDDASDGDSDSDDDANGYRDSSAENSGATPNSETEAQNRRREAGREPGWFPAGDGSD